MAFAIDSDFIYVYQFIQGSHVGLKRAKSQVMAWKLCKEIEKNIIATDISLVL